MATAKQLYWIEKCLQERVVPADLASKAQAIAQAGENGKVGNVLTLLFACPKKQAEGTSAKPGQPAWVILASDYPGVINGWYAVPGTGKNGLDYFTVYTVAKTGYPARLSVRRYVGGGQNLPVKTEQAREWLAAAAVDPIGSQTLFGQTIGKCGKCGHDLTDDASKAIGHGPDCAEQLGIPHPGYKHGQCLRSWQQSSLVSA